MEYRIVIWHQYLARDQQRINRVQIRFLSFAAFILKIKYPQHDYTFIRSTFGVPTLVFRRIKVDLSFISSLLNGSLGAFDFLSSVSFRVVSLFKENYFFFSIDAPTNEITFLTGKSLTECYDFSTELSLGYFFISIIYYCVRFIF